MLCIFFITQIYVFLKFLAASSVTYRLCRSVKLNFHVFKDVFVLNFCLVPLLSEGTLYMISMLLNLLRFLLWPRR